MVMDEDHRLGVMAQRGGDNAQMEAVRSAVTIRVEGELMRSAAAVKQDAG